VKTAIRETWKTKRTSRHGGGQSQSTCRIGTSGLVPAYGASMVNPTDALRAE
jgi:hypothetical protein